MTPKNGRLDGLFAHLDKPSRTHTPKEWCGARAPTALACGASCACVLIGRRHQLHTALCGVQWEVETQRKETGP